MGLYCKTWRVQIRCDCTMVPREQKPLFRPPLISTVLPSVYRQIVVHKSNFIDGNSQQESKFLYYHFCSVCFGNNAFWVVFFVPNHNVHPPMQAEAHICSHTNISLCINLWHSSRWRNLGFVDREPFEKHLNFER